MMAAGASGAEESEAAFAEAHRQLVAEGSIQFQLPRFEPPTVPGWMRALGQFLRDIFPLLEILFWIGLAATALYLLYAIARRLSGADWPWRRRREQEGAGAALQPEPAAARRLLEEADRLAAEGRYSEAGRLLLFRSIEDIDSRRPNLVRPALTSRDIASLPDIPPEPRSAFGELVMAVERSLFGGRALAAADWSACRSAYERFALAGSWAR